MVAIVEIRLSLVNSDYMTRSYNDMSRFALLWHGFRSPLCGGAESGNDLGAISSFILKLEVVNR